jgi:ketosteroid isomerase-like protein
MSTAEGKKSGKRVQVFEGEIVWIMEKQGKTWKIISEEKK